MAFICAESDSQPADNRESPLIEAVVIKVAKWGLNDEKTAEIQEEIKHEVGTLRATNS